MADDETPEMSPSRSSARAQRTQARASLIRAAEGKTMWDVMDGYALDAAVELRLGIDSPDPKERLMSARELLSTYTRMPPRPTAPPAKGMSAEDYQAALAAAASDEKVQQYCAGDAAFQAALVRMGWSPPGGVKPPTPAREKN